MMNKIFTIIIIAVSISLNAQPPMNRYTAELFSGYTETTNVLFSSNVPQPEPGGGFYEGLTGYPLNVDEFSTTPVNLNMNIFRPVGDTLTKRPVIIICFGGGFVTGSKDHWSIRLLAQTLAKRGYVTAVIDYRLGMNMFDEELSKRAVYRGLQDGRSAVRFFKADAAGANIYKIDPENIYIGGHSAGAFIATHNAYLDKETERPASTYSWPQGCGFLDLFTCWAPDMGCLDCAGNNQSFSGHAKAIFSLAGAVGDSTIFMESAQDPTAVLFHSQDDDTVPYDSGEPFSSISGLVVGSDLPIVYGSLPTSTKADLLGIPNEFYSYTTRGHSVHEASTTQLHSDIVPNISNWFYLELLKPDLHQISGKSTVCSSNTIQTYSVQPGLAKYYHWQITGGTFVTMNPSSPTVTVQWDANVPTHTLQMTPYSIHDAKGDQVSLNVNVGSSFVNTYQITSGGSWANSPAWSLGIIPESCHHVVVPAQTNLINIIIPENQNYQILSLTLRDKVTVSLPNSTQLLVTD